jgi:hypothetical protein
MLWAPPACEAVYSLLMMEHGFIAPSINIENLDEKAVGLPIVREYEAADLNTVMSTASALAVPTPLWCSASSRLDLPVSTTRNRKRRRKAPFLLNSADGSRLGPLSARGNRI